MSMKYKILYTLETVDSGGVERRRLLLAKKLKEKGHEVKVVCTQCTRVFNKLFEEIGVEVIPVGLMSHPFQFNIYRKVIQVINEYSPDIIHGGVFEGCTMAAVAGSITKVPIRIIEETSCPKNRKERANFLLKFYSQITHKTIAVSPAVKEYLLTKAKIKPQKIELINNGVENRVKHTAAEIQQKKIELGLKSNDFVVGSIGRMLDDDNKKFSDLIKVCSKLFHDGVPVKLILVGDGKEREGYIELAKALKFDKNLISVGYKRDVDIYYQIMDVFSLISSNESFGLVLAEAMLHKLPVVATDVGGIKYVVSNNETGYLVKLNDRIELENRLFDLYCDSSLRNKMGLVGFNKAFENFTEDVYFNKVEKLYNELSQLIS